MLGRMPLRRVSPLQRSFSPLAVLFQCGEDLSVAKHCQPDLNTSKQELPRWTWGSLDEHLEKTERHFVVPQKMTEKLLTVNLQIPNLLLKGKPRLLGRHTKQIGCGQVQDVHSDHVVQVVL